MKLRFAGLSFLLVALLSTAPSMAEDIDFSKVSCQNFISTDKDDAILMLTFLEGFFTPRNGPPIMYGQRARADAENIRNYCFNNPNADVFTAAKAVIKPH